MIKTSDYTKYYGKQRGIQNINLHVKEGEMFGFIGPNGAGKSTMIRCLLGLIKPTSGQAFISGMDAQKDSKKILSQVGYMPGEAIFYGDVKVKEIIDLSLSLRGIRSRETSDSLLKRFDVDVEKRVSQLSLGNRKKLSIICAFAHEPRLLLLDEPTSGLDPLMKHEFFKLLQERQNEGVTIFLSTHVLSEVQHYCDRAAFIKEGEIIQIGTIQELSSVSAKKVALRTDQKVSLSEGIENLVQQNGTTTFLYRGDMNELLAYLSTMNLNDVTISIPDLEEIFMHYYGDQHA